MPATEVNRNPVAPAEDAAPAIVEIDRALSGSPEDPHDDLAGPNGLRMEISPSMLRVLSTAAREIARGHSITILHDDHEPTTQQASDLLGVSRPDLVSVLEAGKIAFRRTGTHRRRLMRDLLAYNATRDTLRHEHFRELRRASEALGRSDDDERSSSS